MKINKEKFEFEFRQRDRNTVLMANIWCEGIRDFISKESKIKNITPPDYLFTADSCGYVEKEYKRKIIGLIKKEVQKDHRKYVGYIIKRLEEVVIRFEKFCQSIKDKEPNVFLWRKFIHEMKLVTAWLYIPWCLTEENILIDIIASKSSLDQEKISILAQPDKEMLYRLEEESLLNLIKIRSNQKKFETELQNHAKKFSWLNTYYLLPITPLTKEDFLAKINATNSENVVEKIKKRTIDLNSQKILTKNIKDKEVKYLILESRLLAFWLTSSVERSLRATASLYDFYRKLSEKINVHFENWNELTILEIENGLKGKKVPKNFERRKDNFAAFMKNGKINFVYGKEAIGITKYMAETEGQKEIKGFSAFKGKIRGIARIAFTPQASYSLTSDDILVTSMTSPDYLSAMSRVKAFVTDEGGLLCHAAIVARELKKPCIIGTKIATKVLKDGDLVEVDAEWGIVTIIKRKSER